MRECPALTWYYQGWFRFRGICIQRICTPAFAHWALPPRRGACRVDAGGLRGARVRMQPPPRENHTRGAWERWWSCLRVRSRAQV
jgi:hypothetical protein